MPARFCVAGALVSLATVAWADAPTATLREVGTPTLLPSLPDAAPASSASAASAASAEPSAPAAEAMASVESTPAAAAPSPAPVRPEVTIDPGGVPPSVLQVVTKAVDHVVALSLDQDGGEVERLQRRARDITVTALATEGYFSPEVTLEAGQDVGGLTWDITIRPGERSVVRQVNLEFEGAITGEAYAARREKLRAEWALVEGQPFRNEIWESSKRELLNGVSDNDFALARITRSEARIEAAEAQADLTVKIGSGPKVLLGDLNIEGLRRVPPKLIERYVVYQPGVTPYSRSAIVSWQQSLQRTVFFDNVEVALQRQGGTVSRDVVVADGSSPAAAVQAAAADDVEGVGMGSMPPNTDTVSETPASGSSVPAVAGLTTDDGVRVEREPGLRWREILEKDTWVMPVGIDVREAAARRVGVALGVDSDVGARFETMYQQNVVAGQPVELRTGIGVDRKQQLAFADIYFPPSVDDYRDSIGVLARHTDVSGQDVRRVAFGANRTKNRQGAGDSRVEYETRTGVLLAYDDVRIDGAQGYTLPSATVTQQWLRRDVDNKYTPRQGTLIDLGAGVGSALNGFQPYVRLQARGQVWWPIGKRDLFTLRGEVGKVWSWRGDDVPDDFGFRTGGARSIRGYRYLGIGLEKGNAIVGAPTLAVMSAEYQHFFTDILGMAVFVDAGDAARTFKDMDLAVGIGSGLRVRTPAGPLAVDLAYALRDHRVRLAFSLGVAF